MNAGIAGPLAAVVGPAAAFGRRQVAAVAGQAPDRRGKRLPAAGGRRRGGGAMRLLLSGTLLAFAAQAAPAAGPPPPDIRLPARNAGKVVEVPSAASDPSSFGAAEAARGGTADTIPPADTANPPVAEAPPPPASRAGPPRRTASSPSGCPKALLREMLAEASDGTGTIAALAIEREALALCARREEAVKRVLALEGEVRALRPAAPVPAAEPRRPAPAPPRPSWGWFSILGSGDRLRAGVTDGRRAWFVRPGDRLPDGTRIGAVRPSGVKLPGGGVLPYRPPPGGAP